ncbi:MAG: sugar phosphate nucleotidyltransferase, partial [Gammaproteobacteria bacterium]|nr:sugar phosphate nucleotidyltransferase [Gammaproteobacteria bacterium]
MLRPVLLSGGVGSRLWPVSREAYPKQFLPLAGENSMLVDTLKRSDGLSGGEPIIICNDEHRFIVAEQLRESGVEGGEIILEPVGRNTAPAVAVAALQALKSDADAMLLILPADHLIQDVAAFTTAVSEALPLARAGHLVTFGVIPTRAETGYGYIHRGQAMAGSAFSIDRFVEKPDAETAQSYL